MATRPVHSQLNPREIDRSDSNPGQSATQIEPTYPAPSESDKIDLAAEQAGFTNEPSGEPWVLTAADAEAVIDSWDNPQPPSEALKTAYRQYLEMVRQA